MKKPILTLAVSTIMGAGLSLAAPQAQDQAPAPETNQATHEHHSMDPARQVKRLAKRLNLTEDQQNQILPILTDQQQQMKSIFTDSSLSPQDRRTKIRTVREDSDNKIKAVLNDSQKQTFDQMQQQRKERMEQWRKEHAKSTDGSANQS
jgi:Spy/CpxP family protein refolding chaperone